MSLSTSESQPQHAASITDRIDKEMQAASLIRQYAYGSVVVGFIPIPIIDLVALTGVQLKLIKRLSVLYGVRFSNDRGRNIIASLAGASVPLGLTRGVCSMLKAIPMVGTTITGFSMAALCGASTYALGKVFVRHFESGGTFLNFDVSTNKAYYEEQVKQAKPVTE